MKKAKKILKTKETPAVEIEEEKSEAISPAETITEPESIIEAEASTETEPEAMLKTEAQEIETDKEIDPIFAALSEPKLPEPGKENRARLQMQSPNKIFFYWSMKNNPYQTLNKTFSGQTGSYTLVAKLINESRDVEQIFPVEAEGDWWFDTDTDSVYRAEVGFYAPNRPFIRVLYSNTIETPRKTPSPVRASTADWAVSSEQFAKVLDIAGFQQDAFEVAFAGDDAEFADSATKNAFSQILGAEKSETRHDPSEVRYALLALASGIELEKLREQISSSLFNQLTENAEKMTTENAKNALEENFGEFADEETEEALSTVFGASLINFPRNLKRKSLPKFSPISSLR
jgi:hypothetical protein